MAAAVSIFLQWELFQQPDRFHDNWRQMPHFLPPDQQAFHPDDLFLRYVRFNSAPLAKEILSADLDTLAVSLNRSRPNLAQI